MIVEVSDLTSKLKGILDFGEENHMMDIQNLDQTNKSQLLKVGFDGEIVVCWFDVSGQSVLCWAVRETVGRHCTLGDPLRVREGWIK